METIEINNDYELLKKFVNGDHQSLEVLINKYKARIYTYILLMVKNSQAAEDIFQDTFIKVIKSLTKGNYAEKGIFVAWVMRIAHNLVIDYFRKEKRLQSTSCEEIDSDVLTCKGGVELNVEEVIIQHQISKDLRHLVDKLPSDQRTVILLRHYGGLSFKEIAAQTGVSINTALGRMRYALICLRKMIREKNISLTVI